jgi:hypothetical protein
MMCGAAVNEKVFDPAHLTRRARARRALRLARQVT